MGFNYDKNNSKQNDNSYQWSSYSDLFMALSVVFLLLYVTTSLRSGTQGVQQQLDYQVVKDEVEDLRKQIKVYEALKTQYLQTQATQDEQELYTELMDKLSLLQEEANDEKNALRKQARENEKKELALNKYQQMIRNVINSNMLSKSKIKQRNTIITEKNKQLNLQQSEISELQKSISAKKSAIAKGQKQIAKIENQLNRKTNQLKKSFKKQKISRKKMKAAIAKLKRASKNRIAKLKKSNKNVSKQLASVNSRLNTAINQLQESEQTIKNRDAEKKKLYAKLENATQSYKSEIENLKKSFNNQSKLERTRFENKLKKEKLNSKQRALKLAKFKKELKAKERANQAKISKIGDKLKVSQSRLKRAKELINAKKQLAKTIQNNFKKAGVKAAVDPSTGDVIIDFGSNYFDTGRSSLKPAMKNILRKTVPIYSKSLFADPKISKKIKELEIVGFASPTFRGKYVDPKSLKSSDRQAVNYNLDLSYNRAKSIFNYMFDTKNINFKHQKRMLPLVKVTGRSFLAENKQNRNLASGTKVKNFCKKYDCKKAQRVIIKFNLKE